MELRPREQAIESGQTRYFTGKPCKNGHVAERYTLSCACVVCTVEAVRANKKATRERIAQVRAHASVTEKA